MGLLTGSIIFYSELLWSPAMYFPPVAIQEPAFPQLSKNFLESFSWKLFRMAIITFWCLPWYKMLSLEMILDNREKEEVT
jgi:hypothetical protein